jgi:hypothetical protein
LLHEPQKYPKADPSPFEAEIAIAKLKTYKSPGSDQILVQLIQAGGKILQPTVHKPITSIWHKEKLPDKWKESIIVPVHKKGHKTECSNYQGISLLSASYKQTKNKQKTNSLALVHKRTVPTEQLPLVGEVSANFSRQRVSYGQRNESPWQLISLF